jgi:hypothetical protein
MRSIQTLKTNIPFIKSITELTELSTNNRPAPFQGISIKAIRLWGFVRGKMSDHCINFFLLKRID